MLKIMDKLGKLIGVLKDDASEPELNKDALAAKKGDKDATVGRTEESGNASSEETTGE